MLDISSDIVLEGGGVRDALDGTQCADSDLMILELFVETVFSCTVNTGAENMMGYLLYAPLNQDILVVIV